jgi:hypothetical protein
MVLGFNSNESICLNDFNFEPSSFLFLAFSYNHGTLKFKNDLDPIETTPFSSWFWV